MIRIARDCDKLLKVINSCRSLDQLDTAKNMAYNFSDKYDLSNKNELSPYADVINDTVDDKEDVLWEKENERKIGFSLY